MKKVLLTAALLSVAFGFSQELVLNGSFDEFIEGNDNIDAWDMTPPSTVIDNDTGEAVPSPFRALWSNTTLETYLADTFSTTDAVDEQAGRSSNGSLGTIGARLFDDGNPILTELTTTRRLYQRVAVNAGVQHLLSLDSRSETANNNLEVFILNEEIITEAGLENGLADPRVDGFMLIDNDFNASNNGGTNFTTNTFNFTPTGDFIVIYMRALSAINGDNDVFVDNISLVEDPVILSSNDFTIDGETLAAYPVPLTDTLTVSGIEVDSTTLYSMGGTVVATGTQSIDVASLASGAYILEVTSNGKSSSTMVVK